MSLYSLTYMSSAVRLLSQAEIDHLLARARVRNEREGVTGVLLHNQGSFLQVIEGPREGIERIYSVILADSMHHHVLELLYDEIDERDFEDWSMAYRVVGVDDVETDDPLTKKLAAPPGDMSATHHLLASFWNQGLGHRYAGVIRGDPPVRR